MCFPTTASTTGKCNNQTVDIHDLDFKTCANSLILGMYITQCFHLEAKHKIISSVYKRAPHAGASYLSLELRFSQLSELLDEDPRAVEEMCRMFEIINTTEGMDVIIAKAIGGPTCVPCKKLTHVQRGHLLYRTGLDAMFNPCGTLARQISTARVIVFHQGFPRPAQADRRGRPACLTCVPTYMFQSPVV